MTCQSLGRAGRRSVCGGDSVIRLSGATPPQPAGGTKLKRFSQFSAELEALQHEIAQAQEA